MVEMDIFVEMDNLKNEVDLLFRNAGYLRPHGANYLALSTTRRFPHSTFHVDVRKISMSDFI